MSINLKELSNKLGLSQTTVSRALGGYSDVSPTTRERVQQAAAEFGYQPSLAARQVASGRAEAVGIVYSLGTEFLGNPAFLEMLTSLAQRLERSNFDLLLAAAPEHDEMRVYERMVRGRRVDALLVAHTLVDDPRIRWLRESNMPFLAYGRTAQADSIAWFDFDNEAGSRLAVEQLVALGHRRIAYVHSPLEYNFAFQRHAGFVAAMERARLKVDRRMIVGGSLDRRTGYTACQELLALPKRPTAVIVDNNSGGVGMVRALLDAGIAIGSEMSIVVNEGLPRDTIFQDLQVAAIVQPTAAETGHTMAEMLLALIGGRTSEPTQVLRQPVFVPGNSIGPPAT